MTGNRPINIHIPGSAPFPSLSRPRKAASGPLSPRTVAHRSCSGPLSLRERVGVRAPQRPDRFEQDRTGPNNCTPQILHSDQPEPSKTNHLQPLFPSKTLAFRPFRPSEKFSTNHLPHTARQAAPAVVRTTRWQSGRIEPCRTQPNTAEQMHLSKAVQNRPKLTTRYRQSPAKHCRSCRSGLEEKILSPNIRSPNNPLLPNTADRTEPGGVS